MIWDPLHLTTTTDNFHSAPRFAQPLNCLTEDGLVLALVSVVSGEALAQALGVVADSTAGAVTSLVGSVAEENIVATGALHEGAVRATEAKVALAAHVFLGIPCSIAVDAIGGASPGIGGASSGSEGRLGHAHAPAVAVGRADGALARHALVVLEALAFAGLAVARALVGALNRRVSLIGGRGSGDPRGALGARAEGAVVLGPRLVAVGAVVARALVYGEAAGLGRSGLEKFQ